MSPSEPTALSGSKRQTGIPRRNFLARTMTAGAGVAVLPQFVAPSVLGAGGEVAPSARVTVGLIGNGAMGSGHLRRLAHDPGFQLLAVCDADSVRRESGRKAVDDIYSDKTSSAYKGCLACNDYREILARPDIDAVLIA